MSPLKRVADQLAVLRTNNVKCVRRPLPSRVVLLVAHRLCVLTPLGHPRRLIFLINKMDRVKYSQDVFEKVCAELLVLVRRCLVPHFLPHIS